MENISIEQKDKIISKQPWSVLWLSLCAVLVIPALGFLVSIVRRILDPESVNRSRSLPIENTFK